MTVPSSPAGRQHVEQCMGTVFTIAIRDTGDWDDAITDAVSWLHHIDRLFSTYKPDSDISMIRRGQLTASTAHPLVREVLNLCTSYENETDGYFTANLPDGLDPSGLVKGWAIARASELSTNTVVTTTPSTAAATCNSPERPHPASPGALASPTPTTAPEC